MIKKKPFGFVKENMNLIYASEEGSQLWLGSYSAASNLRLISQKKIKYVLTAAAQFELNYPSQMGIKHKIIDIYDSPSFKITPYFQQASNFINDSLKNGNVLVHCAAGISRSTTCVVAFLMKFKGYRFKQAIVLTKSKRSMANPNYGFQNELGRFDISLRKKRRQQIKKIEPLDIKQFEVIRKYPKKQIQQSIFPYIRLRHSNSSSRGKSLVDSSKSSQRGVSLIGQILRNKSISTSLIYNQSGQYFQKYSFEKQKQ